MSGCITLTDWAFRLQLGDHEPIGIKLWLGSSYRLRQWNLKKTRLYVNLNNLRLPIQELGQCALMDLPSKSHLKVPLAYSQ